MPAQQKVPNAIQKALEIRRNSLPRTAESTSEPNLSETAAIQGCSSRLNRKSEIRVSVRSTVRVVVKRLPCRNFELRYLKAKNCICSHVCSALGSVATLQECFDKLGRYGPRTLSRRSVQMAPI